MSDQDPTPPSFEDRAVTHDEALLWLNDHIGRPASVFVEIDIGDYSADLLSCENGVLRHWRSDKMDARPWRGHTREDIAGLYYLTSPSGDENVAIDLTDADCEMSTRTHSVSEEMQERAKDVGLGRAATEELKLHLGENVEMRILAWDEQR